jgi:hypothetical protein
VSKAGSVLVSANERDTDLPDIGFGYEPADFAFIGCKITNSTLSFGEGVAIVTMPGASSSITLQSNGNLTSTGSALRLNRLLRDRCVAELPVPWTYGTLTYGLYIGSTSAIARLDFNELVVPGSTSHYPVYGVASEATFKNCQFAGGYLYAWDSGGAFTYYNIINSLLERVKCALGSWNPSWQPHMVVTLKNDLFHGGQVDLQQLWGDSTYWYASYNMFNNATGNFVNTISSYNGYVNGATVTRSIDYGNNITNASFSFASGPLGNYYQSSTNMFNAGNVGANTLGLYHYTVVTNSVKETNSLIDYGFHYVAVDANGLPFDFDGDAIPDYIEDSNGDGNGANDPISWQTYNSLNALTNGTGLQVFTPLK